MNTATATILQNLSTGTPSSATVTDDVQRKIAETIRILEHQPSPPRERNSRKRDQALVDLEQAQALRNAMQGGIQSSAAVKEIYQCTEKLLLWYTSGAGVPPVPNTEALRRAGGPETIMRALNHITQIAVEARTQSKATFVLDSKARQIFLVLLGVVYGAAFKYDGTEPPWVRQLFTRISLIIYTSDAANDANTRYQIGIDSVGDAILMSARHFRLEEWVVGGTNSGWLSDDTLTLLLRWYLQGSSPGIGSSVPRDHVVIDAFTMGHWIREGSQQNGTRSFIPLLCNQRVVYMPLHLNRNYWALAVWDRDNATVQLMDSLPSAYNFSTAEIIVRSWIRGVTHDEETVNYFHYQPTGIQQQENGADCGFWVVANAASWRANGQSASVYTSEQLRTRLGNDLMGEFERRRRVQGIDQPVQTGNFATPAPYNSPRGSQIGPGDDFRKLALLNQQRNLVSQGKGTNDPFLNDPSRHQRSGSVGSTGTSMYDENRQPMSTAASEFSVRTSAVEKGDLSPSGLNIEKQRGYTIPVPLPSAEPPRRASTSQIPVLVS